MNRSVMVLAGEVSGDMHMAGVIRELRKLDPSLTFWGMGGDQCADAGLEILYHTNDMSVMGLAEVLKKYGFFKHVFNEMLAELKKRKPEAVIMVDYPGFNLRFAKRIRQQGVKKIYYVSPQVWAWKKSRKHLMAKYLDKLLVIFPFEVDVFKNTDLDVEFVGHPLVDEVRAALERDPLPLPAGAHPVLALLPGSRAQELERMLPLMIETVKMLHQNSVVNRFLFAAPNQVMGDIIRHACRDIQQDVDVQIITGQTRDVLRVADAAVVTSGTATIETALMGCPMVVVYKTSWMTYHAARAVVDLPHIGMVNIVAGAEICPELIQHQATPARVSREIEKILGDENCRKEMLHHLADVKNKLAQGSASINAAHSIHALLNS